MSEIETMQGLSTHTWYDPSSCTVKVRLLTADMHGLILEIPESLLCLVKEGQTIPTYIVQSKPFLPAKVPEDNNNELDFRKLRRLR